MNRARKMCEIANSDSNNRPVFLLKKKKKKKTSSVGHKSTFSPFLLNLLSDMSIKRAIAVISVI